MTRLKIHFNYRRNKTGYGHLNLYTVGVLFFVFKKENKEERQA